MVNASATTSSCGGASRDLLALASNPPTTLASGSGAAHGSAMGLGSRSRSAVLHMLELTWLARVASACGTAQPRGIRSRSSVSPLSVCSQRFEGRHRSLGTVRASAGIPPVSFALWPSFHGVRLSRAPSAPRARRAAHASASASC